MSNSVSQQNTAPHVGEVRVTRFIDEKVEKFCSLNPYTLKDGVMVPTTPELVHSWYLFMARHGPKDEREIFKNIINLLTEGTRTFVPVTHNSNEEWVEKIGTS